MPFNNKRNSREDNSKKSRGNSESFKSKGGSSRPNSSSSNDRKPFGSTTSGKSRFEKSDFKSKDHPFNKFDKSDRKPFNRNAGEDSRGGGRPFNKFEKSDRKPFNRAGADDSRGGERSFNKFDKSDRKPFNRAGAEDSRGGSRPFNKFEKSDRKPFNRAGGDDSRAGSRPFNRPDREDSRSAGSRPFSKFEKSDRKPYNKDSRAVGTSYDRPANSEGRAGARPFNKFDKSDRKPYGRPEGEGYRAEGRDAEEGNSFAKRGSGKFGTDNYTGEARQTGPRRKVAVNDPKNDGLIRLNRYISNSGVCSRRKADELIESGVVSVNGTVVTELGTRVDPAKDEIKYNGERLKREKMVYVLLNKPKDYITTTDDPQERRTVMQLVAKATKERIYPVGRLDRNTTGLLLLTNDGNLAEKLSHPRNNISKIYNVELNKNLAQGDFNKIEFGIELEDGLIKPDDLSYVQGGSKKEVGIQIHSGKNRVVRRIFESLGYEVIKLDRVVYANLTKKDLPRGRWRYLEERELVQIKHLIK